MIKLFRIFGSGVLLILSFRVDGAQSTYPIKFISLADGRDLALRVSENQIVGIETEVSEAKTYCFYEARDGLIDLNKEFDLKGELSKKGEILIKSYISGNVCMCVLVSKVHIKDITIDPKYDNIICVNGSIKGKIFGDGRLAAISKGFKLFYYCGYIYCTHQQSGETIILGGFCNDDGRIGTVNDYFVFGEQCYSLRDDEKKKFVDDYKAAEAAKKFPPTTTPNPKPKPSGSSSSSSGSCSGGSSKKNKCCCCWC